MKLNLIQLRHAGALGIFAGLFLALSVRAQTFTQTNQLHAGWNAVWLAVDPADKNPATLLAGLPIESVWTYAEKLGTTEFIKNQNELPWDDPGWRRYIADTNRSFLTTLFALQSHHAYLIKATNAATLLISGRPVIRSLRWAPDAFSLRGFPVDPHEGPTVDDFFGASTAHRDELVYSLDPGGQWLLLTPGDELELGRAYWVYTQGASSYQGPWHIDLEDGDAVDFGPALDEATLTIRNSSTLPTTLTVEDAFGPSPLSYRRLNLAAESVWENLPQEEYLVLGANGTRVLDLAIRRQDMASPSFATILTLKDGQGLAYLVPISGEKLTPPGGGGGGGGSGDTALNHIGLWVGTATITNVSEPHSSLLVTQHLANGLTRITREPSPTVPTPTQTQAGEGSAFPLRLILHVDKTGKTTFLKEVVQMWRDGSYTTTTELAPGVTLQPGQFPNPNQLVTRSVVDPNNPGRFVLLTQDSLIAHYNGVALHSGKPVGRRLSTTSYDFPGEDPHDVTGSFAKGELLNVMLEMTPDLPTNPFRHRKHPDHDNLDSRALPLTGNNQEVFTINRSITLTLSSTPLSGTSQPNYGDNTIDGTYQEVITGLHQAPLRVSGTFRLNRVAVIDELNPTPSN